MKIGFISLGCAKNLTDTETMMGNILRRHTLVNDMASADVMVVNSCSFIDAARKETIDTLEELRTWKKKNRHIILTGCYVEENNIDLFNRFPYIDGILNTGALTEISELIESISQGEKHQARWKEKQWNMSDNIHRKISTPAHYAYLKIGEGCNHGCSFCIIPKLRGNSISKSPDDVLSEAGSLVQQGVKELILVSQDSTGYRPKPDYTLANLLMDLERLPGLEWIRVLYAYPGKITPELIQCFQSSKKVLHYLDMPIQHINDTILNSMKRNTTKKQIIETIQTLRREIPDIKIRTTVMVGFPGETESAFQELHEFIRDTSFDHLGVFAYSNEPMSSSYHMRGQVDNKTKDKRLHRLMMTQKQISKRLNSIYKGQTLPIRVDNLKGGRRYFDSPDIDGFVHIENVQPNHIGFVQPVKITKTLEYDLIGTIT